MPVLSTTAYDQTETALNLTRALINDSAGAVFNDGTLMPLLNSAYRALQRELAEAGVSVLVSQIDLDLPLTSGLTTTELTDTSTPQLPTDLVVPHQLWEQQAGSSELFVPMEKIVSGLPNLQPGSFLRMWEWREDTIQLLGATSEVTVRLRYEKVLPQLVVGTDPISDSRIERCTCVRHCGGGGQSARRALSGRRHANDSDGSDGKTN